MLSLLVWREGEVEPYNTFKNGYRYNVFELTAGGGPRGLEGQDEYIQVRLERTRGGLKLLVSGWSACCGGGRGKNECSRRPRGSTAS